MKKLGRYGLKNYIQQKLMEGIQIKGLDELEVIADSKNSELYHWEWDY